MNRLKFSSVLIFLLCLPISLRAQTSTDRLEGIKLYSLSFALGYATGIFPLLLPATLTAIAMGASDAPAMHKKDFLGFTPGAKALTCYWTGMACGLATLAALTCITIKKLQNYNAVP